MKEKIKEFNILSKYFTDDKIDKYPIEHIFRKQSLDFFKRLSKSFEFIESFFDEGEKVCKDYVKKFISKKNDNFDFTVFNSYMTEFLTLYIFCSNKEFSDYHGIYEPKRVDNSEKNPEFLLHNGSLNINIEVKTLNFQESFDKVLEEAFKKKVYIFKEYLPIDKSVKRELRREIYLKKDLDIEQMVNYSSEYRKVNSNIKNANAKFNEKDLNILLINYNSGLDFEEPLKCILDEKKGIISTTENMKNIDFIIITSLSAFCYDLNDFTHFFENTYIVQNFNRENEHLKKLLEKTGYLNFVDSKKIFPQNWNIFQIIIYGLKEGNKKYIIVPIEKDSRQEVINAIDFSIPQNEKTNEYKESLRKIYGSLKIEKW